MLTEYAGVPAVVPKTNPDGLDMTLAEVCEMSREEFRSVFGFDGLGSVPVVGEGDLPHAPKDCAWYLRHRPAPENPGPKDRKEASIELVVKVPQYALPAAGGGVAVNPSRIGLKAKDVKAACLEALIFLARKQGRRRRAYHWPVERIQSLSVCDLLDVYVDRFLADPAEGGAAGAIDDKVGAKSGAAADGRSDAKMDDQLLPRTRKAYRTYVRAFKRAFPELQLGDFSGWLVQEYARRAPERSVRSRYIELDTAKRGIRLVLAYLGVPPTYHVELALSGYDRLPKVAWTAEEFDRLRAAADGFVLNKDGTPKLVPGPGGMVPLRRYGWIVEAREAWRRAIEFLPYTMSRGGRLPKTRWVSPEYDPLDGKPLTDRPWIEVTDEEVIFHRDGEARYDGTKRRGANFIPAEFERKVRSWHAEDLARGYEFVFHQADGSRYGKRLLCDKTFHNIVKDAGLDVRRIPHHFKDLGVQWSDEAGIEREVLAAHADTSAVTLAKKYGEPLREALLNRAAETMTQDAWRERSERKSKNAGRFRKAKAAAGKAVATKLEAIRSEAAVEGSTEASAERADPRTNLRLVGGKEGGDR